MIVKAELEWTKKILNTINALSTRCSAIASAPLKDLLAKLNLKHQFKFYFGNKEIAQDLRAYAKEALQQVPEPPRRTVKVSELYKQGAKKTAEILESLEKRKEREAEERLAKCDAAADERQSATERSEAMVGQFRINNRTF